MNKIQTANIDISHENLTYAGFCSSHVGRESEIIFSAIRRDSLPDSPAPMKINIVHVEWITQGDSFYFEGLHKKYRVYGNFSLKEGEGNIYQISLLPGKKAFQGR